VTETFHPITKQSQELSQHSSTLRPIILVGGGAAMQWSLVMVVVGTQKKRRLMKGQLKDRARKWLPPLPEASFVIRTSNEFLGCVWIIQHAW